MFIRFTAIENRIMRKRKIREATRMINFHYVTGCAGSILLSLISLNPLVKVLFFTIHVLCYVLAINVCIKEIIEQVVLGTEEEYEDRIERQLYMTGEKT